MTLIQGHETIPAIRFRGVVREYTIEKRSFYGEELERVDNDDLRITIQCVGHVSTLLPGALASGAVQITVEPIPPKRRKAKRRRSS